jgi:anaerobic magnesium-protoporphyrin IX monomethyl ester cyclase
MSGAVKIVLIGEKLHHRSFNGANKALPVLSSSLFNSGFDRVVQLDLERRDLSLAEVRTECNDADMVAFAGCLSTQWPEIDEHARTLRSHLDEMGRFDVPILVGGYATKGVEDVARMSPWINAYFNGEGEEGIVAIARALARGNLRENLAKIPGVCYVDDDSRFHFSVAPRVTNFDGYDQGLGLIHVPAVHDMDIFRASDGRQLKTAQIYTQRGCPWICEYCNKSQESNVVARLSSTSFRSQLAKLRADGFEAVYLDVDTFTVSPTAAKEEARILLEEGFVWGANTRIDRIDRAAMEFFRQHGCVYMFFGVEHIYPEVLLAIRKFNGTVKRQMEHCRQYPGLVKRVFGEMREAGIPSSYFVILGLPKARPSSDEESIVDYVPASFEDDLKAIQFGLDYCDPTYLNLNVLRFMPGSAAADLPDHPAYSKVRPSGSEPITAGYFLPRVAQARGYRLSDTHGAFRLCESVGRNQPASTAIDAQRIYDTFCRTIEMINFRIDSGQPPVGLFIDQEILQNELVWRDDAGRYFVDNLNAFDAL